ncbi:hypothetical protein HK104_001392 [Borealophlyctis nickersoniae]|nr:hypothetical protein HK104_001392 [Borealophlyctis nickersoniae]
MGAFYNILVAFGAAMGGFLFGYEIGVISQVLSMESFGLRFGLLTRDASGKVVDAADKDDMTGWVTFTFLFGCIIGAAAVSFLSDRFGRKRSLLIGGTFFLIGCAMQTAAGEIGLLYAGRLVGGMGIGVLSQVVPVYISETSPAGIRGRLTTIYQLMITIGIFIASCINSGIINSSLVGSDAEWRWALAVQMFPGFFLIGINAFMPYSPRWLMNKNRDAEAINAIAKLRNADPNSEIVQHEYHEIKNSIAVERQIGTASWSELKITGIFNRVLIGITLQFFQQWTGINVILYYQNELVEKMGFSKEDSATAFNLAINAINMVSTLPGMYLVERVGRRKLLLWGAIGMGLAQYVVTLALGLAKSTDTPKLAWLAIVAVFVFEINFASTWGPMVWTYQSEIYPMRIRSKATSCATMSNWTWNAVISKIAPLINKKAEHFTYLLWGSMSLFGFVFTYFCVPETMGKTLEDMDDLFGYTQGKTATPSQAVEDVSVAEPGKKA